MLPQSNSRREFLAAASKGLGGLAFAQLALGETRAGEPISSKQNSRLFATGQSIAAATVHPIATQAAIDCFRRGGNAVDAAVAASLMLSVVDGHNSGIGGGGLALIRLASGRTIAIDGREMAPSRATPESYQNASGQPDPQLSQEGSLAVGVPGLVALLEQLARDYGKLDWTGSLQAAAEVAESGYELTEYFARVIAANASQLRKYPSSAAVLFDSNGNPWKAGDRLRQPDLARSLRAISEEGSDWFYRGPLAHTMEKYMTNHGGLMRADDLAGYKTVVRDTIHTNYRGNQVIGFPPPSSGGIHIAQMLGMLQAYDVSEIFHTSPATGLHLLLEVMKRAMADRVHWLGDTDFAGVPRGLIDPEYLRQRAAHIDLERATKIDSYGTPPSAETDLFGRGGHTTHLTTADADGNVVALTQTINTSFGSKVILPGTGVILNNEMDDFSLARGVRNAFGLLGSEANKIVALKRPLSSMSPAIVIGPDGLPRLTCGAAGGPRIITTVLQTLIRSLDLNEPIHEALAAPRIHHQWSPNRAVVEEALPQAIASELKRKGHEIQTSDRLAVAQAIRFDMGSLTSASDPRVPSAAGAE